MLIYMHISLGIRYGDAVGIECLFYLLGCIHEYAPVIRRLDPRPNHKIDAAVSQFHQSDLGLPESLQKKPVVL
jgi:hypothetical protein